MQSFEKDICAGQSASMPVDWCDGDLDRRCTQSLRIYIRAKHTDHVEADGEAARDVRAF